MTDEEDVQAEERAIYGIIVAAISPVVIGVALGNELDGGASLALVLATLAVTGLVGGIRAIWRSRVPVARIYDRRKRS